MKKRGRPSTFDRDEALRRAMELFWARGYEGVTLDELLAAMGGISPPSFYHAFGSKEQLFEKAADLYVATIGAKTLRALKEGDTAREGIEAMLRATAEAFSRREKPHGCLLVLGAVNCTPSNKGPQDYLRTLRVRAPDAIEERLNRGVADGDLAAHADIAAIAGFYATVIHGLAVRAGDGTPRRVLLSAVEAAMAAWPALTSESRVGDPEPKRLPRGTGFSRRKALSE